MKVFAFKYFMKQILRFLIFSINQGIFNLLGGLNILEIWVIIYCHFLSASYFTLYVSLVYYLMLRRSIIVFK